jgi:hypothetical protein
MNRWKIPDWLEHKVRKRDKLCVYCHIVLKEYPHARGVPRNKATWEHMDNDDLRSATNIVRCCGACNTSKGTKGLIEWFESDYCKKRNINERTVLPVVRNWLRHPKSRRFVVR